MKVELLKNSAITGKLSGYWRVNILDEIPSTQSEIKKQNPENWDLLATEFQSSGRGRLDRTFEASKHTALLFSFYLKPNRSDKEWSFIPLLAGAAVANSINKLTGSDIYKCKWPNDILANDKKIAGLLVEVFSGGLIVGIGINVSMTEDQLPTQFASSINLESKALIDRNLLLAQFCNEFKERFEIWDEGGDLISYYSNISATIDKKVKVIQANGEKSGIARSISSDGSLILESGEAITVGDLLHLRD